MRGTTFSITAFTFLLSSTSILAGPIPPTFTNLLGAWVTSQPFNASTADLPKTSPDFIDFLHRHLPLTTKLTLIAEHNIPMNHHNHQPRAIPTDTTIETTHFEHLFLNQTLLKHQSLHICTWLSSTPAFTSLPLLPHNTTTSSLAATLIQLQKVCMITLSGKATASTSGSNSTREPAANTQAKTHLQVFLHEVLEMAKQLMVARPDHSATTGSSNHSSNATIGSLNATQAALSSSDSVLLLEEGSEEVHAHGFEVVKGPGNRVLCAVFEAWCREEVRGLGGWVVDLKDFRAGRGVEGGE